MSDTIWINIRNDEDIDCNEEDHSAMLALGDELDKLALKLAVKPLSSFYDYTDYEMNMREDEDEDEELEDGAGWSNDEAEWFGADEALASVEAILAHLKAQPDAIPLGHWEMDHLLWELEDARAELEIAVESDRPFHFCIVM